MPEQMSFDMPVQLMRPRLRIVARERLDCGPAPSQLALDFSKVFARVPRPPVRDTVCAGATPIARNGVTLPAAEHAARLGLKWSTVKMRRLRGDSWADALAPELRRTPFMSSWRMHG